MSDVKMDVPVSGSGLGRYLDLDVPPDCDLIVVLTNDGLGWKARGCLLLPHQFREERAKELLPDNPYYGEVAYAPIRSSEIVTVCRHPFRRRREEPRDE